MPLLPEVSEDILSVMARDLERICKERRESEYPGAVMQRENPVLHEFLEGLEGNSPGWDRNSFLQGASLAYILLRRQADVDRLNEEME